jgi:hypothetical protein
VKDNTGDDEGWEQILLAALLDNIFIYCGTASYYTKKELKHSSPLRQ